MKIRFVKCHGSGNDFVLIDGITDNLLFDESSYPQIAKIICDRNGVIGADGALFLLPSHTADVRMRIFNPDGSEPEMCGNGIRCIARKASELLKQDEFSVETMKAVLKVKKEDDIFSHVPSYSVVITNVAINYNQSFSVFNDYVKELSDHIKFTTVNVGNPHIIANLDSFNMDTLEAIGVKANPLENVFPDGVNVSFFKRIDSQTIYVATYERGVGMTYSCGTAMSAASITSSLLGLTSFDKWVNIYNKGGMVKCLPKRNNSTLPVKLLGNATFVYDGEFVYDEKLNKVSNFVQGHAYLDETKSYRELQKFCEDYLNESVG